MRRPATRLAGSRKAPRELAAFPDLPLATLAPDAQSDTSCRDCELDYPGARRRGGRPRIPRAVRGCFLRGSVATARCVADDDHADLGWVYARLSFLFGPRP